METWRDTSERLSAGTNNYQVPDNYFTKMSVLVKKRRNP